MTATIIRVVIRRRDGWTVATSDAIPGLYIASPDAQGVFDDIPDAIRILYKRQHDMDVRVVEADSSDEGPRQASVLSWVALPKNAAQPAVATAG